MPKAVRFDEYGDVDVLRVVDVEHPVPRPGQVLIRVRAAGINPGEAAIRRGSCTIGGRRRSRPGTGATWPVSSWSSGPAVATWPSVTRCSGSVYDRASLPSWWWSMPVTWSPSCGCPGTWPGRCSSPAPPRGPPCMR